MYSRGPSFLPWMARDRRGDEDRYRFELRRELSRQIAAAKQQQKRVLLDDDSYPGVSYFCLPLSPCFVEHHAELPEIKGFAIIYDLLVGREQKLLSGISNNQFQTADRPMQGSSSALGC